MNLKLQKHLPRFITVASLGAGLITFGGVAFAQENVTPTINADGSSGASHSGINPAVDADGPTLVYGDIPGGTVIGPPNERAAPVPSDVVYAPPPGTSGDITATDGNAATLGPGDASAAPGTVTGGSGTALLGPDGTYSVTDAPPSDVTVGESGALAPAPVYEPAPEEVAAPVESTAPIAADTTATEPVAADTAPAETTMASETDLDADNYPDAAELEVGLDPNNPDTDGDGVADGDEANIYFTDPFTWDSDGDGLSDGEELFGVMTDPLVWDTNGDGVGDGETVVV
jgi:hypothetical protein